MGGGVTTLNDGDILLVESNPDDLELILRTFRMSHLKNTILVARDGTDALEMLLGTGPKVVHPALVLLDLKLLKTNGIEVLKALRSDARTALLPIIVLTSSEEEEEVIAAYHLGVKGYLRKPLDFTRFIDVTNQVGMYWLLLDRSVASQPG